MKIHIYLVNDSINKYEFQFKNKYIYIKMSLTCEYCKKIFKTTTNLNRHQRTTKSCIKIQKETINCLNLPNIIIHVCEFCDKFVDS